MVKYYAEITNFDNLVGMMRRELEKRKLWENTIFMVCSEQGTQLPFAKWTCYDNGLRTGFVAHWTGVTRPGSVIKDLVTTADVTPTLVDAAGGTLKPGACDGMSFLPLLKGKALAPARKYVFGAFTNCRIIDNRDRIYPIRSIRDRQFSLIYNPNHSAITSNVSLSQALKLVQGEDAASKSLNLAASWVPQAKKDNRAKALVHKLHHRPQYELYDLNEDPFELVNKAYYPKHKKTFDRLKKALRAKLKQLGDSDPIATETSLVGSGPKKKKKSSKKKG
jgi:uncharacterized sulfatase